MSVYAVLSHQVWESFVMAALGTNTETNIINTRKYVRIFWWPSIDSLQLGNFISVVANNSNALPGGYYLCSANSP